MPQKMIDIRVPAKRTGQKNAKEPKALKQIKKRIFSFTKQPAQKTDKTGRETIASESRAEDSLPTKFNFKFVYIGVCLGILILFSWFVLPCASIEIQPKYREISFERELVVKADIPDSDFDRGIIAGRILQIDKEVSQEMPSTGIVDKKAKGIIRVYNKYSTSNQTLVATTRFVSANGKLFRTPKKIVVPGGRYEKGKLVPGFIDIEVAADQPGEEYNIEATTFSIPGFAGSDKYTLFYAQSFSEMKGGGQFPQVNEKDLERAKESLSVQAKEKCWEELRVISRDENLILFEDAVSEKITEAFSLATLGAEQEKFDYKVKASLTAVVLPERALKDFVTNFFNSGKFENEKINEDKSEMIYSLSSMNFEKNEMVLDLDFVGKAYSDIDILFLKKSMAEKSSKEVEIILENEEKIRGFKFELWPFWVKKVPNNLEKIKINVNLD